MKKTPLHSYHMQRAKMAEFAGFEMPLFYNSALEEVKAVREGCGLFDVSHMGVIEVKGSDAEAFLDWVATNQIAGRKEGAAIYTVLASEKGGCIDDVMVLRLSKNLFTIIANASNKEAVAAHFDKEALRFGNVSIEPLFDTRGILAIQGKRAEEVLRDVIHDLPPLKKHTLVEKAESLFGTLVISRTGYTGEDGFEVLVPFDTIESLWNALLSTGKAVPCGLAARDILRLEMGYALFGHELSPTISPLESVSFWTVKMYKERFLGKESLQKWPTHRAEQGIVLLSKGVMREGYPVFTGSSPVGIITSGGFSPTLGKSVAIALLKSKLDIGDLVDVEIRGKKEPAEIVPLPFIHHHAT